MGVKEPHPPEFGERDTERRPPASVVYYDRASRRLEKCIGSARKVLECFRGPSSPGQSMKILHPVAGTLNFVSSSTLDDMTISYVSSLFICRNDALERAS